MAFDIHCTCASPDGNNDSACFKLRGTQLECRFHYPGSDALGREFVTVTLDTAGMTALRRYLLDFRCDKVIIPGWAGELFCSVHNPGSVFAVHRIGVVYELVPGNPSARLIFLGIEDRMRLLSHLCGVLDHSASLPGSLVPVFGL